MTSFLFDDKVEIVRRPRRRTSCIQVLPNQSVRLLIPQSLSDKKALAFLQTKSDWIHRKQLEAAKRQQETPSFNCLDGDSLHYLGHPYSLRLLTGSSTEIFIKNQSIWVCLPSTKDKDLIRQKLISWYQSLAKDIIIDRVHQYTSHFSVQPNRIRIKSCKTRWGSCSSKRNLNFNWALIMAPLPIIDSVVVHELCHLIHLNHSKAFWNLVKSLDPDYLSHRDWLKEHGHLLSLG